MSATSPDHPLHRLVSDADHEGFELRVPDAPLAGGLRLGVVVGLLAPIAVVLAEEPTWRWLWVGSGVALLAFFWWLSTVPVAHRLRLTSRTLTVHRRSASPLVVQLAGLDRIEPDRGGLWLFSAGGPQRIDLPGLSHAELAALASEVSQRLGPARRAHGTPEAVPRPLQQMRAPRAEE